MHHNLGIGSWIARRARMTPRRVALAFGPHTHTYAELDQRITRLARGLAARGVKQGDRVAFLGDNHPAALETLFACGLLGAAAVPLHPGFDAPALAQLLRQIEPAALIVTAAHLPRLESLGSALPAACFTTGLVSERAERYDDLIGGGSDEPLDRAVGLEHTCLIAFSSGTTGPNKGVRLTHGNLLFNVLNTLSCLDYASDDTILTSAPLYRMGGLGFTLALLFKGGRAVLQERTGGETSLQLIARHRVSILFDSVPALEALCGAPTFAGADLSSLRICATGGAYVPPRLQAAFAARGLTLQPGYGLTEAAPLALLLQREDAGARPGAAGTPAFYCSVRVVDDELEDVAPDEVGELLVRGPNVTPGYFRAPQTNARAFAEGWLRTGDAASVAADGVVSVVGRLSDALWSNGRRVHPAPIEAALRDLRGVHDCAIVQAQRDAPAHVFLTARDPAALDVLDVAACCRACLGLDVETVVHRVEALPTNPNGKVVRERLRDAARRLARPRGMLAPG